eukprot:m.163498 g.163498  ORF g.163498 m.163498 type:complete len:404 (+) comp23911_c1_seq3:255-1466(+)
MGDFTLSQAVWVVCAFVFGVACTLVISSETREAYVNARAERNYVVYGGGPRAPSIRAVEDTVLGQSGSLDSTSASITATTSLGQRQPAKMQKYGFYLHVYNQAAAVMYQVKQIKQYFPGSPIYVMSDGGDRFDGLCQKEGCTFKLCPPANDRWHPWPFLNRFYEAAVALNAEYIIMLEPDNTIHRSILHPPTHDAGGLYDENPHFSRELVAHAEAIAHKIKPEFNWSYTGSGLAGGSYFRRAAILDAFSDDVIASIDWAYYMQKDSKRVFSSDFAMPIALAERGYTYAPWAEIRQVEPTEDRMTHQPKEAAIQHYGRGVAGGKPTYNLRLESWQEEALIAEPLAMHRFWGSNCQLCYNLTAYKEVWGSDDCTNRHPYTYAPGVMTDGFSVKKPPSKPFYPIAK